MSLYAQLQTIWQLGGHQGWDWLAFRATYELQRRVGLIEHRFPVRLWDEEPLSKWLRPDVPAGPAEYALYRSERPVPFFFSPGSISSYRAVLSQIQGEGKSSLIAEMDALGRGVFRYFEHSDHDLGWPPDWHRNPKTSHRWPASRHWTHIGDFDVTGDIKLVWEPSRFASAFKLVRAYWATGDERYPQIFWALIDSWRQSNPPQLGPNWHDGQELALRVLAWVFALFGFSASQHSTPERIASLAQMIAVHADRIAGNIALARSMRNNHVISEAVGLWTVGLVFPEFRNAEGWVKLGRGTLIAEGLRQIYPDGAYAQHSFNYQRLMLHDYLWAIRLGDLYGHAFPADVLARVQRSGELLFQVQDEYTGCVPNYGANDGALILPLNTCDYNDYRPVVQAIHFLCTGERVFDFGPWDEDLFWIFGEGALSAPQATVKRTDWRAEDGGYYTLRSSDSFAMVRSASFKHRPSQADMLHVDLWWRGYNILVDPGTFSYHAATPWDTALGETSVHNTVTVDGLDQMERRGKFLWLPWISGQAHKCLVSPSKRLAYLEVEHNGYERLPDPGKHRRAVIRIGNDCWCVLDCLGGTDVHDYRIHWLFPDVNYVWNEIEEQLILQLGETAYFACFGTNSNNKEFSIVRADEMTTRGWRSQYYQAREPALSLALHVTDVSTISWAVFGPQNRRVAYTKDHLSIISDEWEAQLKWSNAHEHSIVSSISVLGRVDDILELA